MRRDEPLSMLTEALRNASTNSACLTRVCCHSRATIECQSASRSPGGCPILFPLLGREKVRARSRQPSATDSNELPYRAQLLMFLSLRTTSLSGNKKRRVVRTTLLLFSIALLAICARRGSGRSSQHRGPTGWPLPRSPRAARGCRTRRAGRRHRCSAAGRQDRHRCLHPCRRRP